MNFKIYVFCLVIFILVCMTGSTVVLCRDTIGNLSMDDHFRRSQHIFLVDDFEDGNLNFNPEWFQFGNVKLSVERLTDYFFYRHLLIKILSHIPFVKPFWHPQSNLSTYALVCTGKAHQWYVGGLGTYLGIDGSRYHGIHLNVYGHGVSSGRLKIELFDDDNGNWVIEMDNQFNPLYDDRWAYTLNINWHGWRRVDIPFSKFIDVNPGIGDDIWNPDQVDNSGGLIQMQFVMLSSDDQPYGLCQYLLDDIVFY